MLFLLKLADQAGLGERRQGPSALRTYVVESSKSVVIPLGECEDPILVYEALAAVRMYVHHGLASLERAAVQVVGHGDGNLGNVMWDGHVCRLLDFEDSGVSEPAYEVADLVEHVTVRIPELISPENLVEAVGLNDTELKRFTEYRSMFACFWLLMLLPGGRAFRRNPSGSTEKQARHLLKTLE